MVKSKIFNSVMRYMLVAMLALLPNAIWADGFNDLSVDYADNNYTEQTVYGSDNTLQVSLGNLIYTKLKWATQNSEYENSQLTGDCIYVRMNVVNATTGELADISGWTISYGQLYNSTAYDKANYTTSFNYNNYYYNDKYFFFLSNYPFRKHSFDFRITAPIGVDLSQYKVLFYLSNEKPKLASNSVVADPTIKAKVSYELINASSLSFKHYVGHANTALDDNGMQQTAEWEYYVYVKMLVITWNWYCLSTNMTLENLSNHRGISDGMILRRIEHVPI